MINKVIYGHNVSACWSDEEDRYRVFVDGTFIGGASTSPESTLLAQDYIEMMENCKSVLKITLDEGAYEPVRGHADDAGLDLMSTRTFWLHPGHQEFVDTGVHVQIPKGYVGMLTSKSGLMKGGITTRGTIDSGYTGSIGVVMYNHGSEGIKNEAGQKITQMILIPIITPVVEVVDKLNETERGEGGFGSTGK